jgi:bla regulator protein BlaR1
MPTALRSLTVAPMPQRFQRLISAAALALGALATAAPAQALHPTGPLSSFEVATIKPMQGAPPPRDGGPPPLPHDQLLMYVNTRLLIGSAYNVQALASSVIVGGPGWIDSQIYEIHAKINGPMSDAIQQMPGKQRQQQIALMEQSLLADRFHLQVHFETRELPEFAIVVAKGGPKLRPAADPSGPHTRSLQPSKAQGWELKATGASISTLASILQPQPEIAGRLIVDKTGLTGSYDVTLDWSHDSGAGAPTTSPDETATSLFTALQQQLGLRLVETKGPVEVIVIDHIDHPTEN